MTPITFKITDLPPFNFKELFIIVHIQSQKVRIQLDSGKYDGVEFIWGVVGDQSERMLLQSLNGKIQRMSG
jgi:hypothetical protein